MKNNTENVLFLLYQHFMNTLMLYSYDLNTETVWLLLLSCSGGKINTYLQLKDCDLIIVHAWEDVEYLSYFTALDTHDRWWFSFEMQVHLNIEGVITIRQ